jgi:hypothetical protein
MRSLVPIGSSSFLTSMSRVTAANDGEAADVSSEPKTVVLATPGDSGDQESGDVAGCGGGGCLAISRPI